MSVIYKGCTCKNTFTIPYAGSEVEVIYITYQQNGATVVEKSTEDCEFGEGIVSTMLSQEDTLAFTSASLVRIQLRIRLKNGTSTKSKIIETYTDNLLKDEVI